MLGNGVQGYQRGLWLEAYGWEFRWPELGTKSVSHKRLLAFQGEGWFRCKKYRVPQVERGLLTLTAAGNTIRKWPAKNARNNLIDGVGSGKERLCATRDLRLETHTSCYPKLSAPSLPTPIGWMTLLVLGFWGFRLAAPTRRTEVSHCGVGSRKDRDFASRSDHTNPEQTDLGR